MKFFTQKIYLRNHAGQYVGAITRAKIAGIFTLIAIIIGGLAYSVSQARASGCVDGGGSYACPSTDQAIQDDHGAVEPIGCIKVDSTTCDFTDQITKDKTALQAKLGRPLKTYETSLDLDLSVTGILKNVCYKNGIEMIDCPKTLYAMAEQESYMGKAMTGDDGHSHGYFHIMDYNGVSLSCSEDLACSADWSLKRMIKYGYKTNPDRAVMIHNGTPNTKATLAYLAAVKSKKALWPE